MMAEMGLNNSEEEEDNDSELLPASDENWAPHGSKLVSVRPTLRILAGSKYMEEVALDELSPMWANWTVSPHHRFYIRELSGIFTVKDHEILRLPAYLNALDLLQQEKLIFSIPYVTHPIGEIAHGHPVFVLRIMPWADMSPGNRSQPYNAHMNMYIANINLPHQKLSQEYFHTTVLQSVEFFSKFVHIYFLRKIHNKLSLLLPVAQIQLGGAKRTSLAVLILTKRQMMDTMLFLGTQTVTLRTPEETILTIKRQIKAACLSVAYALKKIQTDTGVKDKSSLKRACKIQ
ncbi:hypothetical protein B0H10DRAFT_1940749 [Mycena sp. CBHHK59/15]|nr:hypothetical protein B0H10DRAFT_1970311 [Mycena sp. CBHHK59/15]KAJ6628204.1 hypothetical protein B0H10DRAFT_1940749 [Mycena sp. CBHHK59/15]